MAAVTAWRGNARWGWVAASVCGGLGCGVMGPLLPWLAHLWGLPYNRSGLLLGMLFAGSFCGTLTLERRLDRSVRRGVLCAAAGMGAFALCTRSPNGYIPALGAIAAAGFGLGSLMSSVNLIAGRLPADLRTGTLARLSAAWCVGAVLSPLFAGERLWGVPLWARLLALALLFPLCLADRRAWIGEQEDPQQGMARDDAEMDLPPGSTHATAACAAALFLYGGAEACISGWLPSFTSRYGAHATTTSAQWVTSAFWFGLIVSRLAVPVELARDVRDRVLKLALTGTAAAVLVMAAFPWTSGMGLAFAAGGFVGPGFPLMLSGCLDWRLGTRRMATVLAAAALGAAVCPLLLGQAAVLAELRGAMLLPALVLIALPWLPWRTALPHMTITTREQLSS